MGRSALAEHMAADLRRREAVHTVRSALRSVRRVALTTHINADGDGAGSEAAVAHYLGRCGIRTDIVNPTPFPDGFRFLLEGRDAFTPSDELGREALSAAELVLALDTAEVSRMGSVGPALEGKRVAVLDHHPPAPDSQWDPAVLDASACATGELVYDLITAEGDELRLPEARGIYVAIVTDTGSFRFQNTSVRAHLIAAELVSLGVDPEAMYRRLFGQYSRAGLRLVQRALGRLQVDPELPLAWVTLTHADLQEAGATSEDLEGIVEYPRRLVGVEVALLIRELPDGRTKASLRSNGDVGVSAIARDLGGGGHEKAAGVLMNAPLDRGKEELLERVRSELRERFPAEEGAEEGADEGAGAESPG